MNSLDELKFAPYTFNRAFKCPGAYILKHIASGMFYVGSTGDISKRIIDHLRTLRAKCHDSSRLQSVYDSDPEIHVLVILTRDRETAYDEEQRLLDNHLPTGKLLNVGKDARASQKGIPLSQQAKDKIRDFNIGKTSTPEANLKRSQTLTGITRSAETRAKMSAAKLGKIVSAETRAKISVHNRARIVSDETRRKMSLIMKGRTRSEEANEKARQAQIRRSLDGSSNNTIKVSVNGVVYPSMGEAARCLKIHDSTLRQRIWSNNPLFKEYVKVT